MSDLHRKLAGKGLPSGLPPRPLMGKVGGIGRGGRGGVRKSYTPVSWRSYWDKKEFIETDDGKFCVYHMGSGPGAVLCLLHGGGYSALTWSVMARELTQLTDCRVVAMDLRGHGETQLLGEKDGVDLDLSGERMANDVRSVLGQLYENESAGIVLVGHSMGGALATIAGEGGWPGLAGLVVVDVVEGTALEALASMHTVLQGRPRAFSGIEQAVEWCVRSGQVRNHESARVSMPGQVMSSTGVLAAKMVEDMVEAEQGQLVRQPAKRQPSVSRDSIREETEEVEASEDTFKTPATPSNNVDRTPPETFTGSEQFRWRIDLARTEPHWSGWFTGLSTRFLSVPTAKLLLLAGVDRLDRELTVGQMQGKFQMQVLPQVGHTVHEDSPDRVAEVLATFLIRNKLCTATDNFTPSFPAC